MNEEHSDALTERVINQRIRNRIIECLEAIASDELSAALGAEGVVNLWYDFVPEWSSESFSSEIYTNAERDAIRAVSKAFDRVVRSTPNQLPAQDLLKREPVWAALIDSAGAALAILKIRGRFEEDE